MKVLHVYKTYWPEDFTGVPRVIHGLAEGMVSLGVETHVLTLGDQPTGTQIPVDNHVVHLARRDLTIASAGMSWPAFSLFRSLSSRADIVHYHFPWPFADLLHFHARPSSPTVLTYHSDIVRQKGLLHLYAPVQERFLGDVDCVIATSPTYAETSPVLRRFKHKTKVIPIGIPDLHAPRTDLVSRWKERLGEHFFLFVGTFRYYKGLEILMEASRITGLPVVVAGAGDQSELAAMAGTNVKFVGEVAEDDKIALLELCRAFAFPSHLRAEAFGIALLEAARAGRAMITAEIGTGTSYINLDQVTGISVAPGDANALAAAMRQLACDPNLATDMGTAARARYEAKFQQSAMIAAHLHTYRHLLDQHSRRRRSR